MSFIQCKDENEVAALMNEKKFGFITEDYRVYDVIQFSDEAGITEVYPETLSSLIDLQHHIEMLMSHRNEMPFTELVLAAQGLQDCFRKAVESIHYKPLKRAGENHENRRSNNITQI